MIVKDIVDEDFINYKKPSMFIIFPTCNFKCCREAGCDICQNSEVVNQPNIEVDPYKVVNRYANNPITKAVVCAGLEPMDSFEELIEFISILRETDDSDVVIYTGYWPGEVENKVEQLKKYKNIVVKYGRFKPD